MQTEYFPDDEYNVYAGIHIVEISACTGSSGGEPLAMNMRQLEAAAEAGINLIDINLNLNHVLNFEITDRDDRCPQCRQATAIVCALNREDATNRISLLSVALMTGNDRAACMLVGLASKEHWSDFDKGIDIFSNLRPRAIAEHHHCILFCDNPDCDDVGVPLKIFAAPEERIAAVGIAVRHGLRLELSSCWRVYGLALNRVLHGNTHAVAHVIAFAMHAPSIASWDARAVATLLRCEGGCDLAKFARERGELPSSREKARACLAAYERAQDELTRARERMEEAQDDFWDARSEFERAREELTPR